MQNCSFLSHFSFLIATKKKYSYVNINIYIISPYFSFIFVKQNKTRYNSVDNILCINYFTILVIIKHVTIKVIAYPF